MAFQRIEIKQGLTLIRIAKNEPFIEYTTVAGD